MAGCILKGIFKKWALQCEMWPNNLQSLLKLWQWSYNLRNGLELRILGWESKELAASLWVLLVRCMTCNKSFWKFTYTEWEWSNLISNTNSKMLWNNLCWMYLLTLMQGMSEGVKTLKLIESRHFLVWTYDWNLPKI
jgi:hypothetical protein